MRNSLYVANPRGQKTSDPADVVGKYTGEPDDYILSKVGLTSTDVTTRPSIKCDTTLWYFGTTYSFWALGVM